MKVKLTYFKRSGKRYADGEYFSTRDHMFQIYEEVAVLRDTGRLPGLIERNTHAFWIVLVEVPDHPHNVPQLIGADDANEILTALLKLGPRHDRQLSEPTDEDTKRWDAWDEAYVECVIQAKKLGVIE
jgi:hypothetical protein